MAARVFAIKLVIAQDGDIVASCVMQSFNQRYKDGKTMREQLMADFATCRHNDEVCFYVDNMHTGENEIAVCVIERSELGELLER